MKIILYLFLIILVAMALFGLYYGINSNLTSISDAINGAFNNAADWINTQIQNIAGNVN